MSFYESVPWHGGEVQMHHALHVPEMDNPAVPMLSAQAANMLQHGSLLALGTVDDTGRPWTTLWGGDSGFAQRVGQNIIGIRTPVAVKHDPIVEILLGKRANGDVVREEGNGRMVAGLAIDLEARKRVKLNGRMIAGALGLREVGADDDQGEIQLAVKVEQSLGNCPKYLNSKHIVPAPTAPKLISRSTILPQAALKLLAKSDMFFMSTRHSSYDMDTNHRGGSPGFVRLLSNDKTSTTLVYPEYSGNRLYQSLGNLATTPLAGLCFPDFETGNCLYVTGTAEILIGASAAALLPRSNLAVKLTVTSARYVASVLPFRGISGEFSPYNPSVRYLSTEKPPTLAMSLESARHTAQVATLISQIPITPTISRFRFALSIPMSYVAGQYVTLSFAEHLDIGYSHMRDDDPRSLNDDFVRTFTVSSPSKSTRDSGGSKDKEFEITIRKVGVVTDFLFDHGLDDDEARRRGSGLEIEVMGVGGNFEVKNDDLDNGEEVAFVAAGVGITPLMPCTANLDLERFWLLWAVRMEDLGLVVDLVEKSKGLGQRTKLFVTGGTGEVDDGLARKMMYLQEKCFEVVERRLAVSDVTDIGAHVKRYYVCTGSTMRKSVLGWLPGKEVVFEDYNF